MIFPNDIEINQLKEVFGDPELHSFVQEWIACVRGFELYGKDHWAVSAYEILGQILSKLPYDAVRVGKDISNSPDDVAFVTAFFLKQLGFIK